MSAGHVSNHVLVTILERYKFSSFSTPIHTMDHKRAILRSWLNKTKPVSLYSPSLPQPPLRCPDEKLIEPAVASCSSIQVANRRRAQLSDRTAPYLAQPGTRTPADGGAEIKLPAKVAMKYPSSRQKPIQVSYKPVTPATDLVQSDEQEAPQYINVNKPKKRPSVNHKIERERTETGRWLTLHDTRHNAKRFFTKPDAELFDGLVDAPHVKSTIDDDSSTPPMVVDHYARHTLLVLAAALDRVKSDRAKRATTQWTHSTK
jgi:hypothetical protein